MAQAGTSTNNPQNVETLQLDGAVRALLFVARKYFYYFFIHWWALFEGILVCAVGCSSECTWRWYVQFRKCLFF